MTPKEIEDIRSWRRGEWVADITEIESMVYGLLDELDLLRAAADSFRSYLDLLGDRHNELADRSESARHRDAYIAIAGAIAGIEAQGRTLGLFTDKP